MTTASEKLRRIFNRRYAAAIGLLAVAACLSFGVSFRMSMIETNRSDAFALVSAQRTDSQRIAFLITGMDKEYDKVALRDLSEELLMSIARMRSNHDVLFGTASESARIQRFIAPLADIYATGEVPFDERVREFLEQASEVARADRLSIEWDEIELQRREVVATARDTMLQTHGLMSLILEAQAVRANRLDKVMGVTAWLSTLALLGIVTLLIFRPMIGHVLNAVREMEEARSQAREAEEVANVANEAKGHFFQAASHELKTPLNAILGMTDAIRDKDDVPQGLKLELGQIVSAADQLLNLLNNILDTHRLTDGQLNLDVRDFLLREVIERPLRRIKEIAEEKGLEFTTAINIDSGLMVEGDAQRIEQIVANLVDNAVKFTTDGGVHVDACMVETGEGTDARFSLSVRDTGIGIPIEEIESLFEPVSAVGSILERNGGLGVGLMLVRAIASSMGGSVDVTSEEGEGSTFKVSVPLSRVSGELAAPADQTELSEDAFDAAPGAEVETVDQAEGEPAAEDEGSTEAAADDAAVEAFSVLIVDDNMANRMVAEALVKPLGAVTDMVADGKQAVDAAMAKPYDLILMDISMPVMDGVKATQLIRQGDGPNRETSIVALTAHVGPGEWEGLGEVGFNDILNKPVRKDVIERCIDKWVRRKAPAQEQAA